MARFMKRIQVLLTEEQYRDLEDIASKEGRKLGTMVREAVEEYHIKKKRNREIAEAVDRLLALPPTPVPETWEELEEEIARGRAMEDR
jgi:predicted DNA-binding protein